MGAVAVEYRMRCYPGVDPVRADNSVALAVGSGRFDHLQREFFAAQSAEKTGGFTTRNAQGPR